MGFQHGKNFVLGQCKFVVGIVVEIRNCDVVGFHGDVLGQQ